MPTDTATSAGVLLAIDPAPELLALLAAAGLPTSDMLPGKSNVDHADTTQAKCQLFTLTDPGPKPDRGAGAGESALAATGTAVPVCCIGWEQYGSVALLRSLVVHSEWRGCRLGQRLVSALEVHASNHQVEALYLLTETAVRFFASLGYAVAERHTVPAAIASTAQFAGLCPASATLMHKHLLS